MGSPKYLGIDIGNSGIRIVELLPQTKKIGSITRLKWRSPIGADSDSEHLERQVDDCDRHRPNSKKWLAEITSWLELAEPVEWLISSVRGDACEILSTAIARNPGHRIRVVRFDELPIGIRVLEPDRVGIDRLLAAVAAVDVDRERSEQSATAPLIVIQAGSAVTVDWVTFRAGKAYFEGGAILPGVPMMLRLLGTAADQLPQLDADLLLANDLRELPVLPGRNTEQAMLCGAASALVGGAKELINRYRNEWTAEGTKVSSASLSHTTPTVILSGGDGPRLASYIPDPLVVEPDLVLRGLLVLAAEAFPRHENAS